MLGCTNEQGSRVIFMKDDMAGAKVIRSYTAWCELRFLLLLLVDTISTFLDISVKNSLFETDRRVGYGVTHTLTVLVVSHHST